MKKIIKIFLGVIAGAYLFSTVSNAQTLSPKVTPTSGGYGTGGGNSFSWTMGETFNATLTNGITLTQGEQQAEIELITSALGTTACPGANVSVSFTASGYMDPANIFTAQLSNAAGSFASPVSIGTLTGTASGSITTTLPLITPAGSGYRIRVVSSSPVYTGTDNGSNISINGTAPSVPTVSATPSSVFAGNSSVLSIVTGNLNGATNWQWYTGSCGGTSAGSGTSLTVTPAATTVYYVRGEGGCISPGNCATVTVTVVPLPVLGDYQSHTSGAWNVAGTWERFNGTIWVTGAGVPTSSDGVITIQNTHTVNVTSSVLADQVIVNSGGTISIQAGASLNIANGAGTDLDVNGAFIASAGSTIDGAGLISINSGATFTWSGGVMQGSGTTSILSGAIATLNGGAKTFVGPRTLSNASSNFTLSSAYVQIASGNNGIINNSGTMTITDDNGFAYVNGFGCVFTNTGTITKSGGTGTGSFLGSGTVNMAFHNQGTVNVNSGTIRLGANGTHTGVFNSGNSSIFSIESSAITFTSVCSVTGNPILNFPGGGVYTFNSGCTIAPAVSVNHSNGTVNWDNSPTFSSYTLSTTNSNMAGSGIASISGTFNWAGGTMSGAGTTAILNTATAILNGGAKTFSGPRTLNNASPNFTLSSANVQIASGNNGIINNSGTITITDDNGFAYVNGFGCVFTNTGTITKTGGTGTGSFLGSGLVNMAFHNQGTVNVNSGTIRLGANGTHTGVFNSSNSGIISIESSAITFTSVCSVTGNPILNFPGGGVYTFNSGCTIAPAVSVNHSNGTINWDNSPTFSSYTLSTTNSNMAGSGIVSISGTFNWAGGTMSGAGTTAILNTATAILNGGAKTFSGPRTLNNASPNFTLSSANVQIASGNNGIINNSGTITITDDNGFAYVSGFGTVITNTGTITKTGGTGTGSFLGSGTVNMAFHNQGTVNVNSGTIRLGANGTHTGVFNSSNSSIVSIESSAITFTSVCSVTGNPILNFPGGGVYTFNSGCTIAPAVSVNHSNGTVNWDNSPTFSSYTLSTTNSNMAGSGIVSISGAFNWTGGNMSGSGTTAIQNGATATFTNGTLAGTRIFNNASANFTHSGILTFTSSAPVFNNSGAINLNGDFGFHTNSVPAILNNLAGGIITKTAGTGTSNLMSGFFGIFNNSGIVNVNSGTINISGGGTHGGTYNVAAGKTLTGGNIIYTGPSITNNGSITLTGLSFSGSSNQTLTGNGNINSITINNSNNVTLLGGNHTINNSIQFTNGKFDINNNDLVIASGATITTPGNASYIKVNGNGSVIRKVNNNATDVLFPVGGGTTYLPVLIQFTAGSVADSIKVRLSDNLYSAYDVNDNPTSLAVPQNVVRATYFIKEVISGGSNATVKLQWNSSNESSGFIRSSSRFAHYSGGGWSLSSAAAATGSNPYTLTQSGITSFSPFGVIGQFVDCSGLLGPFCVGQTYSIPYSAIGTFNAGNVFTMQLSNSSGSFSSPVNIGSISSVTSGSINVTIPIATILGSGYRVRIVSTTPAVTSEDNGNDITINLSYTINATAGTNGTISPIGNVSVCGGSSQTYTITPDAGYHIDNVLVDGISNAGAIATGLYTFSFVSAGHTIFATFVPNCVAPSIGSCSSDITSCISVVTFSTPSATGTPTPIVNCVPASGSNFSIGTTSVICTATNACGSSSCSFNVTINEAPVIGVCPANITQCDNHVATFSTPSATGTPAASVSCSPASGSTFASGTTTVNCTATNSCGSSSCSFNVTINETPAITCLATINGTTTNPGGMVQTYTAPSGGTPLVTATCTPASGSNFPIGSTTVNCSATNSCGTGTCSFNVVIVNNCTGPLISACPSNIVQCGNSIATWTNPTAIGNPAPTVSCSPASGSIFSPGTTTVTCNATSTCGTDQCSFTVTINETPVISACPANITQCDNYVATWTNPTATGTPAATVSCSPASGSTFSAGTTNVTCIASNSCGSSSCSFSVTINETPVISACPANITKCNNHLATWTDPTASGTPAASVVCAPASGSTFAAGTSTVTCTASNSCGSSSCSFTVTINETPVISACPSDISTCNPVVTYATPTATGTPAATVNCSPASGSTFAIGTTTVTCTASNSCGTSSCSFNIMVNTPSTAASSATSSALYGQICLGGNVTLTANGGSLGTGASWVWYEGGCGSGSSIGTGASITITPATNGAHAYFVRAEGACGNTACVSVTVNVISAPPSNTIGITAAPTDGCVGSPAQTVSVNAVANCTFYNWTSSQAGVRFNGNPSPYQTTIPTVSVTFVSLPAAGASGWSICVFGGNACGNTNTICTWVRATVSAPASITGSVIGCPGSSGNNYSSSTVAGAASYQWSSTGGIVVTGNGSQAVTVAFPGGFVSGTLSVRGQTACGYLGTNRTITINANPAIPGIISGLSYPCPNSSASYSIAAVPGAANYTWTTSVPGAVVTGTGTSCSIAFPATIPAGSTVSVVANSSCPTSSPTRSKGIATGLPGVPLAISGPATGQCGATGVSYTINPVFGATGYNWTASCGTILGPSNLSGITIDWPASFTTCTLSVTATNACGTGIARTLVVFGAPAIPASITGNALPCNGSVESYSASSTGATSYNWIVPAGAVILGPATGASILVQWGATGGNITVTATNACGTSGVRSLPCVISCRQSQVAGSASGMHAEVYPNPATDKATVKFSATTSSQYHLIMTDVIGRNVLSTDGTATEGINMVDLNLNNLAKGVYMLNIMSGSNNEQIRVVVE